MANSGHSEGHTTTSAFPPTADVARPGNERLLVTDTVDKLLKSAVRAQIRVLRKIGYPISD